jgi:hypothetical protein
VTAIVWDVGGRRHFLTVDRDFLTIKEEKFYLPIGTVYEDKEKGVALIEFPFEADSGSYRAWVPLLALLRVKESFLCFV